MAGALLTKALLLDEGKAVDYGAVFVSDRIDGGNLPRHGRRGNRHLLPDVGDRRRGGQPERRKDWAAFAIGATLGLVVMVLAPLTGGGFNPARAFGPALVSGELGGGGEFFLVYIAGARDRGVAGGGGLLQPLHRTGQEGRGRNGAVVTPPSALTGA